ncbi:nodal homolog 2-A-like [Rhinophrynus dorsalis]
MDYFISRSTVRLMYSKNGVTFIFFLQKITQEDLAAEAPAGHQDYSIFCLVQGMPSVSERTKTGITPPGSKIGLKASPKLYGIRHTQGMKYPLYMMELYKTLIMGNDTDLSILEHPELQESDAVLSLVSKNCSEIDNHWSLSFDMSSISSSNELRLAELRIHLPSFQKSNNVTVEIYHTKEGQENFFLGSFKTDPSLTQGSSWKVFNITKMLQSYLHQREHYPSGEQGKAKDLSKTAQETSCTDVVADRVMLVVFAKDKPSADLSGSPSLIKTVESSKYVSVEKPKSSTGIRRSRRNRNAKHSIIRSSFRSRPVKDGKHLCKRVEMIVDFDKIGWGQHIIYPKRFNAYRCEGSCPVPLSESFKPTNHAYIKSLYKFYESEKVDCNSCVPVKMNPLSMLMYVDGEIVLKHHEDMIVEDCGCN